MPKVIGLKQLNARKYKILNPLPPRIIESFGQLENNFIMTVWGQSGQGKSNLVMDFIKAIMPHGKVLYVSLEEGHGLTMQNLVLRHLNVADHVGKIEFADNQMKFEELNKRLKKRASPQFIVIDSLQYFNINYLRYQQLKEAFPKKAFIFISHAEGKQPKGKTAKDIKYDCGLKIWVEGYIAFITSRYGGNKNYVIWEEGAKKHWGTKAFKKHLNR